jgi:hypothetical protein
MGFGFFGIGSSPDTPQINPDLNSFKQNPWISSLYQQATNNPLTATPVTPQKMGDMALPQYDAMRARLNTQYNQTQQQGQDSIDRQFAAMGGGPGNGAQLKQTENLTAGIAQQKGQDLNSINAEEAQARTGLQQQDVQNNMQAQEFNSQQGTNVGQFNRGFQASVTGMGTGFLQAQSEAQNNQFNAAMANWQAQHSGGLLGQGGFLGGGFGA